LKNIVSRVLFLVFKIFKMVHPPGLEPGSPTWQAEILTTIRRVHK
jgi:hypothetical protein